MSSVTTESAADTVVVLAPATDVHSAPSKEGVVATIDVSPTIQPGKKKNRWICWLLTLKYEKKYLNIIQNICLQVVVVGPTNNPAVGALSEPVGNPLRSKVKKAYKKD